MLPQVVRIFPQGGWETDESPEEAARRETVEEAGVRGELDTPGLGEFHFYSSKPGHNGVPRRCTAYMYVLHVSEVLEEWPEARERQRQWMAPRQAMDACRYDWMKQALRDWAGPRGWL